MISAIQTALSGLQSASQKLTASASNIANISTVGSLTDPDNAPYTPLDTASRSQSNPGGVLTEIVPRDPAFTPSYAPNSPFADENGLVDAPNIDIAEEAVNMKLAELSYKANIQTIEIAGEMQDELLNAVDQKA